MKAVVTFEKHYPLSMCSHLDLQTIFGREFRRAGLDVEYSQGFNPHPVLSFAMPLSLGFEGDAEVFEVGVSKEIGEQEFLERLNGSLPKGLYAVKCSYAVNIPTLMSLVYMADYEAEVECESGRRPSEDCERFMALGQALAVKPPKNKTIDIRPLVYNLSARGKTIYMRVGCGNNNLNPKILISYLQYGIVSIKRVSLLKRDGCPVNEI